MRKTFPEFKNMSESKIKEILFNAEQDRSYHSEYSICYLVTHAGYTEHFIASQEWQQIAYQKFDRERNCYIPNGFDGIKYCILGDSCWAELPSLIADHCRDFDYPKWLLFNFDLFPYNSGASSGGDQDDYYYDDDDYWEDDPPCKDGTDLSRREIIAYHDWLVKSGIIDPFDIERMMVPNGNYGYLCLDRYNNINNIYFACVLLRYMHEGQNLCRRIMKFDRLYDLDPYVNIVLAHYFADRHYNGGHCVCDQRYWWCEHFGGDYWHQSKNDVPPEYQKVPTAHIAQIAWAMRYEFENGDDDREKFPWMGATHEDHNRYPYFSYEKSLTERIHSLDIQTLTPSTWRALLAYDSRRKPCQLSSQLDATPRCFSWTKKAA
jgi:hypothetical protein